MKLQNLALASLLIAITSGCSLLPTQQIEIASRPIERNIVPPPPVRPVALNDIQLYVVSEAKLVNRCNQIPKVDADGKPVLKQDGTQQTTRPKVCDQKDREHPDWPEGYTKKDQFEDIIRDMNKGDLVFVAMTISDYKILTENNQDLVRWIRAVKAQEQYWLDITGNNPELEKNVKQSLESKEPVEEKKSGFKLPKILGGKDE